MVRIFSPGFSKLIREVVVVVCQEGFLALRVTFRADPAANSAPNISYSAVERGMSALGQDRPFSPARPNVRFATIADIRMYRFHAICIAVAPEMS